MTLQDLQSVIAPMLGEIEDAIVRAGIKGCKVSFAARHPSNPEMWIYLGNDDTAELGKKLIEVSQP